MEGLCPLPALKLPAQASAAKLDWTSVVLLLWVVLLSNTAVRASTMSGENKGHSAGMHSSVVLAYCNGSVRQSRRLQVPTFRKYPYTRIKIYRYEVVFDIPRHESTYTWTTLYRTCKHMNKYLGVSIFANDDLLTLL